MSRNPSLEHPFPFTKGTPKDNDFKIDSDISVVEQYMSNIIAPQIETDSKQPEDEPTVEAPKTDNEFVALLGDEFEAPDYKTMDSSQDADEFMDISSPGKSHA